MATVNMNAVQFYDPSSTVPSLSARCAAALQKHCQSTGIPHRKEWSRVLESYSQSQNISEDIAGNQDRPASDDSIAVDEDDDFPPLEDVLRPTSHLEDSTEKHTNSALAAQGTDKTSLPDGNGSSMPAELSLPGHLDGSKEQPVILDDDDDKDDDDSNDDNTDDDSENPSGGGISSDSNTDSISRELGPPPPTTLCSGSRPSSSRDLSLYPFAAPRDQSLKDQAIQQDNGYISRERSEQPSCPTLILSDDEDDERKKGQQHQEAGEDREQGACTSDTSSNSDIDNDDNHLQDSDESEGPRPAKRRWPSPSSSDPISKRSRKQRLQRPHDRRLASLSKPARADLALVQKEPQRPSPSVFDNSDDSEAPRPAKRRRPSPSNSDPTSNRSQKRRPQRPSKRRSRSRSKQDRSHTAPPQTQPDWPWSISSDDCAQSQYSSTNSSKDGEPISTTAEYREWPMHGFFKRTTIGNEIRYSIDFSLEQLQGLCGHATSPSSDKNLSAGRANLPKVSTRVKKTRAAPPSRSKRTTFTSEEDALLVDLRGKKSWPWKEIEPKFPQRTLNSLQVHYCTKLKGKVLTEGDESE